MGEFILYTMYCVRDEMQSTWESFSTAVQNFNSHILRRFHSNPKAIWLLRQQIIPKSSQIIYIQSGSSLKKQEAYILYYFSSISLYYIMFM
jgi:hypothetical protein